jgi:hypothetical protein
VDKNWDARGSRQDNTDVTNRCKFDDFDEGRGAEDSIWCVVREREIRGVTYPTKESAIGGFAFV